VTHIDYVSSCECTKDRVGVKDYADRLYLCSLEALTCQAAIATWSYLVVVKTEVNAPRLLSLERFVQGVVGVLIPENAANSTRVQQCTQGPARRFEFTSLPAGSMTTPPRYR
jgi:hypothetical protein